MKRQIWFETNLSYYFTWMLFRQSQMITGDMQPWKGRLTFYLKNFIDVTIQITTRGKLGITFPEEVNYKDVLEQLKPLLVTADNVPAEILGITYDTEMKKKEVIKGNITLRVKRVLRELRKEYRFLREPSVKEIAIQIGKAPEDVQSKLYELAPETGWKEQAMEKAKKEAQESINLAGWMKWLQKGDEVGRYAPKQIEELNEMAADEIQRAPKTIVRRAENILNNYPELVPEAKPSYQRRTKHSSGYHPTGLDPWPKQTNLVWRRVFREEAPKSGRSGPAIAWIK